MLGVFRSVCVATLAVALSAPLYAQWPVYPTAGVPRTTAGKPILDAATPRMPDGKTDFSGIWQLGLIPGGGRLTTSLPISQFAEVAGRGYPLPLQPWAAALKKKRMAGNSKDNPNAWCLPLGLMQYHNDPQPREIVQTTRLMLIT